MNSFQLPNLAYTRTYRLGMEHIAKLYYLAGALKKDQSEIVREAIEEYFERHAGGKLENVVPATSQQDN